MHGIMACMATDDGQQAAGTQRRHGAYGGGSFSGGVLVARVQEGKPGSDDSVGFWKPHRVSLMKENIDLRAIEERERLQN